MTKLNLSMFPVNMGTPLSEDELKSILGGNTNLTRQCTCTYIDSEGKETKEKVEADSEYMCSEKCWGACRMDGDCVKIHYEYVSYS